MPTALHSTAQIDYNHCKIYHKLQENACRRCRNVGHLASDLSKCPAYIEDNDVIAIRFPNCIYSNYYICKIRVFGMDFLSSEHAYQWRFAKDVGTNKLANEILMAPSPSYAKQIASKIPRHLHNNWHSIKICIMKQILHAKADYVPRFREELIQSEGKQLVEATRDLYWSSGLSPKDTQTTDTSYYPGRNQLGRVLEQVRADLIKEALLTKLMDIDSPADTEIVTYSVSPSATTTSDVIEIKTPSELNDMSKTIIENNSEENITDKKCDSDNATTLPADTSPATIQMSTITLTPEAKKLY